MAFLYLSVQSKHQAGSKNYPTTFPPRISKTQLKRTSIELKLTCSDTDLTIQKDNYKY